MLQIKSADPCYKWLWDELGKKKKIKVILKYMLKFYASKCHSKTKSKIQMQLDPKYGHSGYIKYNNNTEVY